MINILLDVYNIENPHLYCELKNYIKPNHSVAVIALAFRDSQVKSLADWNLLYGKENSKYYSKIVNGLAAYGISEDNIKFINYYTDSKESAAQKIISSDIIYFLGGLPDRMLDRIMELGLYHTLMKFDGIVMGYSAGALIQLAEYHLSPDDDYPEFKYCKGLPYLDNFYLQVHYEDTKVQNESIKRVISERKKTVYATDFKFSSILVDNGNIKLIGNVKTFNN